MSLYVSEKFTMKDAGNCFVANIRTAEFQVIVICVTKEFCMFAYRLGMPLIFIY